MMFSRTVNRISFFPSTLSMRVSKSFVASVVCAICMVAHAQVQILVPAANANLGSSVLGATHSLQTVAVFNSGMSPIRLGDLGFIDQGMYICPSTGCAIVQPDAFVVDDTPGCAGKILLPNMGCSLKVGFAPTTVGVRMATLEVALEGGGFVRRVFSGTGVSEPLDCVLDWAQKQYPTVLTNPTATFTASQFHARCYQGGALCVGADTAVPSFAPPSAYVLQYNVLQRLGTLSDFAALAKCQ